MEFVLILVLLFIYGSIFGSFFTVVGLRGPLNQSIVKPRSHCTNCGHVLSWYELIPILSWVIQGGKCRSCKTKLSVIYPLIETLCGFLFALAFYLYGVSYEFFAMLVISSLLINIYVSDFSYYVILDEVLYIAMVLILILKFIYFGPKNLMLSAVSGIILFLFMLLIKFIGDKSFKTESLGGGDIKLAMFFGFALGVRLSFVSLVLGSFLAFPYAIYFVLTNKEKEIPFGPFLMTGMLIIFLLETQILDFINILM